MNNINKNFPQGKLVIRTLAMPKDINVNGDIFGGWIMSQIDLGGAILAKEISKGKVTTLRVKDIIFLKPISIGDLVSCYAKLYKIGISSINIKIEIWTKKISSKLIGANNIVAKANLIYVAIDENKNTRFAYNNYFIEKNNFKF
ncbi:acyl-CoA thioester hydrolase YciA [Buchnera aphidicola (Ceratovacuna keduensis)]|uniref:acyl-CoA thioester hydrolase YciA n=1 Tax=Buchnera aphidicola TaxID=9 RepID=UPI0031B8AC9F